ncbi:SAF domain-containing protein [Corynebacterium sp. H128]|uniref:SAF domain-containing protein n=1 Tax=unclassified Corynebacterium TaxID=2624378 RepID=UPI0030991A10
MDSKLSSFHDRIPTILRTPGWRRSWLLRRALAFALIFLAAGSFLHDQLAAQSHYVVARTDIRPGTILTAEHIQTAAFPNTLRVANPVPTTEDAIGKVAAAPLTSGDILTERSILGTELARAFTGTGSSLVPVRLADPAAAELAVRGAQVSIVTQTDTGASQVIAENARVVFGTAKASDSTEAGTVLLAMAEAQAQQVAAAALSQPMTIVMAGTRAGSNPAM